MSIIRSKHLKSLINKRFRLAQRYDAMIVNEFNRMMKKIDNGDGTGMGGVNGGGVEFNLSPIAKSSQDPVFK